MIKSDSDLNVVKRAVKRLEGGKVVVTQNLGRNKFVSYLGVVSGVYPALFTVLPKDPKFLGKTSFSYTELICNLVKIQKIKT